MGSDPGRGRGFAPQGLSLLPVIRVQEEFLDLRDEGIAGVGTRALVVEGPLRELLEAGKEGRLVHAAVADGLREADLGAEGAELLEEALDLRGRAPAAIRL